MSKDFIWFIIHLLLQISQNKGNIGSGQFGPHGSAFVLDEGLIIKIESAVSQDQLNTFNNEFLGEI